MALCQYSQYEEVLKKLANLDKSTPVLKKLDKSLRLYVDEYELELIKLNN